MNAAEIERAEREARRAARETATSAPTTSATGSDPGSSADRWRASVRSWRGDCLREEAVLQRKQDHVDSLLLDIESLQRRRKAAFERATAAAATSATGAEKLLKATVGSGTVSEAERAKREASDKLLAELATKKQQLTRVASMIEGFAKKMWDKFAGEERVFAQSTEAGARGYEREFGLRYQGAQPSRLSAYSELPGGCLVTSDDDGDDGGAGAGAGSGGSVAAVGLSSLKPSASAAAAATTGMTEVEKARAEREARRAAVQG